jgi:hypothetical protein
VRDELGVVCRKSESLKWLSSRTVCSGVEVAVKIRMGEWFRIMEDS